MWGFSPPNSLECNLVLEKLPLFCTTSSCWLLFVCLCHWADQSFAGFTGSITCECVWKCRLITGAHLSGQRQAGKFIDKYAGESEWTIGRLRVSSVEYKEEGGGREMEFENHARLLGEPWFSKIQLPLPLTSRLSELNKVAKQTHNFSYGKHPSLCWDEHPSLCWDGSCT